MILLDAKVVSEPRRRAPDARIVEWMDAPRMETLYLSAITVAELRVGVVIGTASACITAVAIVKWVHRRHARHGPFRGGESCGRQPVGSSTMTKNR